MGLPSRSCPPPRAPSGAARSLPARAAGQPHVTPVEEAETRTRHCPRYKVFLHNDPVTPMHFVVEVLRGIFALEGPPARAIMMMEAHERGVAFVTALSFEQAEFRVDQAHSLARGAGYPLTFTYEPE